MRTLNESPPPPYSPSPSQQQQQQQQQHMLQHHHHHPHHHHRYGGHSHQHSSHCRSTNSNNRPPRQLDPHCDHPLHQTTRFGGPSSTEPLNTTTNSPENNQHTNRIYTMTSNTSSSCTSFYDTSTSGVTTYNSSTISTTTTTDEAYPQPGDHPCCNGRELNHGNTGCNSNHGNSACNSNHGNSNHGNRWYRKYCNHRVPAVVVFGVVAAIFSVTYLYMVVVYRLQPTPVVDEAFHIPQAQKYCQGKFTEWDPKLTTLPGLYLFSIGITGPVSWLFGSSSKPIATPTSFEAPPTSFDTPPTLDDDRISSGAAVGEGGTVKTGSREQEEEEVHQVQDDDGVGVCSVLVLRLVNVVVAPCILLALHSLMCFMHTSQSSEWWCLAGSVSLVLLPPLFWFYSLYYTEPLATMLVLLMLLLHCHANHAMAAAIGAVSIMVRQTNIVWVVFLLLLRAVDAGLACLNTLHGGSGTLVTLHSLHHCKVLARRLRRLAHDSPLSLVRLLLSTARQCLPYLLLVAAFAVFVYANGGLVVGDRSAHEATLHLTQVFYFFLFVLLFSPTLAINSITGFFALCCRQPKSTAFLLMLTLSIIHNNTLVHPYLLADNRHYTFYLWNRFYARHRYFRYFMAPVYLFGGHLVWNVCLEKRSNIFRLIYMSCVALSVVPQRLLEPRYFILPFLICRIQRSPSFATGNDGNSGNGAAVAEGNSRRNSNARNSEASRGSFARSSDGFRGNAARSADAGFRGNPARLNVRGAHVRNSRYNELFIRLVEKFKDESASVYQWLPLGSCRVGIFILFNHQFNNARCVWQQNFLVAGFC